jgi:hypothetical protein
MTGVLAYHKDCQLLRAAAELLRLPQPVVATSLVFLHRFHHACPEDASGSEVCVQCQTGRVYMLLRACQAMQRLMPAVQTAAAGIPTTELF